MTIPSTIVSTSDISFSEGNAVTNLNSDSDNILHIRKQSVYRNFVSVEAENSINIDRKPCDSLPLLFDTKSFEKHFQPDSTIALHGEQIEVFHMVVSGIVRCCTINSEGVRQIFRFAKMGDFLGISDIDTWHFTAEAIDHVILKSIPHAHMKRALATNTKLRDEIRAYIGNQVEDLEQQLLSMARVRASERLYEFLCEFATSSPGTGYITLPMCRRDIADHLGLSVETVSRTFSELKRQGRIDLESSEKYRICKRTGIIGSTWPVPHVA